MSSDDHEARISVLESTVAGLSRQYQADMLEVKGDLKTLLGKFNTMTGGQKAWFMLFGLLGTVAGIVGTIITGVAYMISQK